MSNYREYKVWQMSMDLAESIYTISKKLPKSEVHGLISQIQRAAVSIPSNIAEGSQRGGKEFAHFLRFSAGSTAELDTQLKLVTRLYGVDTSTHLTQIEELQRMIHGLIKKVR